MSLVEAKTDIFNNLGCVEVVHAFKPLWIDQHIPNENSMRPPVEDIPCFHSI